MGKSIITFTILVFTLVAQAWSLAIKSDKGRSAIKQSTHDAVKRDVANGATQQDDINELRRSYAMILEGMKNAQQDHPFGFGIGRSNAFIGKKKDYFNPESQSNLFHGRKDADIDNEDNSATDDQNTSVFHGKRNEDMMSEWLANNQQDAYPSRSSYFHGKKDMSGIMRYLLKDLDNRATQKNVRK